MSGAVTTLPAQQPLGGQPLSPLGASMMGPSQMGLQNPLANSQATPLMSMLLMQQAAQNPNGVSPAMQGVNGVGNLMGGNQWNGMPGAANMAGLNAQAGANVAAGGPY